MKRIYCLLILLCPYVSFAQGFTKPITIGEKVPDISFTEMVNGKARPSSIARYQGKLLVLDFMSTSCAGCVKSLANINKLQQEFDGSMQLIMVSVQKTDAIKKFLQNSPAGRLLNLPFVTEDTALRSLFPYEYISHLVWIGSGGIVKAITEAEYFTAANIRKALQEVPLNWPVKNDLAGVDLAAPMLQLDRQNVAASAVPAGMFYRAFYKHMPGMPPGMQRFTDSGSGRVKLLLLNQCIPDMYRKLYDYSNKPLSHIILQGPQSGLFVYSEASFRAGWELYNTFCYEAVQPEYLTQQQCRQQALADIGEYTGTRAYLTDTLLNGYVLRDTATARQALAYKQPAGDSALSISGLLYTLNNCYGAAPVADGRMRKEPAWLLRQGKIDFTDINTLNRLLLPYGLVLQPQPQQIQALVITQTGPYPFTHSPKLYAK